tara:strand:+ start:1385 stop:1708 length:324 start_codon:yes stop_codon:yes gene_type:complete
MKLKGASREFSKLCLPSKLYFVISMVAIVSLMMQNGHQSKYCVGSMECDVMKSGNFIIFVVKVIYVLFWTWLLNIICKAGHANVSWFLVLMPFILYFILIALIFLNV